MPRSTKFNIVGKRFSRLVALSFCPDDNKYTSFMFECDCGNIKKILAQSVVSGNTTSCGCYQKEALKKANTTHGHSGKGRTKTYNTWAGMMGRGAWGCHPSYQSYGAKGIDVCDRWRNFEFFLQDMGERPEGTSIDRIDNEKGYFPGNCRWATRLEQDLNTSRTIKVKHDGRLIPVYHLCNELNLSKTAIHSRATRRGNDYVLALRSVGVDCDYPDNCKWTTPGGKQLKGNRFLTHDGVIKTVAEWSRITGINNNTLNTRIKMGWTDERILTCPVRHISARHKMER